MTRMQLLGGKMEGLGESNNRERLYRIRTMKTMSQNSTETLTGMKRDSRERLSWRMRMNGMNILGRMRRKKKKNTHTMVEELGK